MNERPTVKARRIGIREAMPQRNYVYNGTQRLADEPKPGPVPATEGKLCGADDCSQKQHAKGYCTTHYTRLRVYGSICAPDLRKKENR